MLLHPAEVNAAFNINLLEYNNFEAGEGKTVLNTHFAHVSHKIVCWVHEGNNLDSGEQLQISWRYGLLKLKLSYTVMNTYMHFQ